MMLPSQNLANSEANSTDRSESIMTASDNKSGFSQNQHGANRGVVRILTNVARSVLRRKLTPPGFPKTHWKSRIAAGWRPIRTGMNEGHALEALGNPDETYPFGLGKQSLTLWVYDKREEPVYLWLDEAGTVKMTCRTGIESST
jgi:hypothetical protein